MWSVCAVEQYPTVKTSPVSVSVLESRTPSQIRAALHALTPVRGRGVTELGVRDEGRVPAPRKETVYSGALQCILKKQKED